MVLTNRYRMLAYTRGMTARANPPIQLLLVLAVVLLAGCQANRVILEAENRPDIDFSGNWELDFQLSDDLNDKLELEYLLARRSAELARNEPNRSIGGPRLNVGRVDRSLRSLIDLGRFTDMITRSNELDITHLDDRIIINRVDDYPLECRFHPGLARSDSEALGTELCGWDQHQLIFLVVLDDGLRVRHRLTLSPESDHINIATTVTAGSGSPFTLNRVFSRFEPLDDQSHCVETLARKRVCTRVPPES